LQGLTLLDAGLFLATVFLAVLLKLSLAIAEPAGLTWILSSTTFMVKAFTGLQFFFDPLKGYVNFENAVVIGKSCAGVNYLVIALCMTVFSFVPRFPRHKLLLFAGLVLAAYVVTVMVNSFRIIGGIALLNLAGRYNLVVTDGIHEAEGIFVYFSFLVLYYRSLQALLSAKGKQNERAC
jgi:exosortase K